MSTVYSLVCFGGRTGKTVTISNATPAVVTLTNHGLRYGTGVAFSTTGALPIGITAGTTYYAKSTASNTFNLYDTAEHAVAGGSTGRVNTSSAGSGTHTVKGAFFLGLTSGELARYGSSGSERIYDGLVAWNTARSGASAYDTEICEIGEAFTESVSSDLSINVPAAATRIETKVNGVRSAAYHGGVYGAGYKFQRSPNGSNASIILTKYRITVDGFTVAVVGTGYNNGGIAAQKPQCSLLNMFVVGRSDGYGIGVTVAGVLSTVTNCVSIGWSAGIYIEQYIAGITVANCQASKNTTGFYPVNSNAMGFYYNNISIGNTTNWGTQPSGMEGAANNAGLSGEAWGSATRLTIATTDFIDYANNDFRPASSSSPQVETGVLYYGALPYDIADDVRPNYMDGAVAYYDVGAYEFDHGYGLEPVSTTVTFAGVNAGSEIRVYNSAGTELAGVETCDANHVLTWTVPIGDVTIRIVHTAYKIKEFDYTSAAGAQSLPVQQDVDDWYSNPA